MEYVIQLRGAAAAEAQVRGLTGEMGKLAASQRRVGASGDAAAAGSGRSAVAMGMLTKVAKVGALSLVAVGLESVKMANSFDTQMLRIRTEGGATSKEFAYMKQHVVDLAKSGQSMGQGPTSLAMGLYHLESMGLRGRQALLGLKLAAQEAAISGSHLEDTTSAIGGAMYVAMKGTGSMTHMMGTLNAIAGAGNMRFQDLNEALGTGLLGSAKLAHLSLQEVGAALAVLTDANYKASSAGAQLATSFHFLTTPTAKATKALASIGISQFQLAHDMNKPQGLLTAFKDLRAHLQGVASDQKATVMNALMPGGRGRVLSQLYVMQDRLAPKYAQTSAGSASQYQGHVAEQLTNSATRTAIAWAKVQAQLVDLGHVLQPLVNGFVRLGLAIGGTVVSALTSVVKWFERGGPAVKVLTTALVALVAGFAAYKVAVIAAGIAQAVFASAGTIMAFLSLARGVRSMSAAWALLNLVMDANPIFLIIAALAALAAGLIYAYHHSKTFRDILDSVGQIGSAAFGWIVTAVKDVITWVGNAIAMIQKDWPQIKDVLIAPFTIAKGIIIGFVNDMIQALNWVIGGLNKAISGINSATSSLPFGIGGGLTVGQIGTVGQIATSAPATPRAQHAGPLSGSNSPAGVNPALASNRLPALQRPRLQQVQPAPAGAFTVHATFNQTFSHPIVVNGREIARVNRRETIKAMAAGA